MEGDKEVGIHLIGYLCSTIQLHKLIRLSRINHLDIGTSLFYQSSKSQGELQREILLLRDGAYGTCIMSAMSSIDDQCKVSLCGSASQ